MGDAKTNPPLRRVYETLYQRWGAQGWWPAETRYEILIGAILTQNTAWRNVEQALSHMKQARVLTPQAVRDIPQEELAALIRPAGTHNVKAQRIKAFNAWLFASCGGNPEAMRTRDAATLRDELLAVRGIGEETADCMLLYAAGKPVFVVDAYTRRVLSRHGWIDEGLPYAEVASRLETEWAGEPAAERTRVFGEFHALLVRLAKEHCRSRPDCGECPLKPWLPATPS